MKKIGLLLTIIFLGIILLGCGKTKVFGGEINVYTRDAASGTRESLVAIPLGVGIAVYLTEYARRNKAIYVLRILIDMLTGVPSIVFGFVGITLFLVILKSGGPVIYGGALVMVANLLPVVIRATEESLLQVLKVYVMRL